MNDLTKSFVKHVKKSARDEAVNIAKRVREESEEIVVPKILRKDKKYENKEEVSMMQQVMTGNGKIEEIPEKEKMEGEAFTKKRLSELEGELANWREKRTTKESEWTKEQEETMGLGVDQTDIQEQPVIMPSSPQKGPQRQAPGRSKKGTMEEGRTKKG